MRSRSLFRRLGERSLVKRRKNSNGRPIASIAGAMFGQLDLPGGP